MKKIVLLSIYLFAQCIVPNAQEKVAKVDKLSYTGYYNWGFIWMKAGLVEFQVKDSDKYPDATYIEAFGSSIPSWDWVFKLRDTLTSHFDKKSFQPYKSSRMAHEGNYHKLFDYHWDYDSCRVYADVCRVGKYRFRDTIALKPETCDILSVAWKVRELNYEACKKGDTIPIKLLLDDEVLNLYVRFLGEETIKFEKKSRMCYVLSPMLVEGEVFKKGENMKIWLSKDKYRLPLIVEAKILVGSIKGILDLANSKYK